jgi:hypothetical protein
MWVQAISWGTPKPASKLQELIAVSPGVAINARRRFTMKPIVAVLRRTLGQNRHPFFAFNRYTVAQFHSASGTIWCFATISIARVAGY